MLQHSARQETNMDFLTVWTLFYTSKCKCGVSPPLLDEASSSKLEKCDSTRWNATSRELQSLVVFVLLAYLSDALSLAHFLVKALKIRCDIHINVCKLSDILHL